MGDIDASELKFDQVKEKYSGSVVISVNDGKEREKLKSILQNKLNPEVYEIRESKILKPIIIVSSRKLK